MEMPLLADLLDPVPMNHRRVTQRTSLVRQQVTSIPATQSLRTSQIGNSANDNAVAGPSRISPMLNDQEIPSISPDYNGNFYFTIKFKSMR